MNGNIQIGSKLIGDNQPCFIIAEMSGNHNMNYARAEEIVRAAKEAGADAIKLQTYTADTITLNSDKPFFYTDRDGLWSGQTLYQLYKQAYTPWEWQPKLKKLADELGIILFSSPFDITAVDYLEKMDVPAYKIASFEINDVQLLRKAAGTGKPIIISTGIASLEDIELAIQVCREAGNNQIILLKCTSAYPAPYEGMNLRMIPNMKETFGYHVGLSDHSMGEEVSIAAVTLGANVIEKHFTLKRSDGGIDSAFSMEVQEMKEMITHIRHIEKAMGRVDYRLTQKQLEEKHFSRSLFASKKIHCGEQYTYDNIRSVRPGIGLHTKYLDAIIGKRAAKDIDFASPLTFGDVDWRNPDNE